MTHVGKESVVFETENELAYEEVAHIGLLTVSNGGLKFVKKTILGFLEIVLVAGREQNGAGCC